MSSNSWVGGDIAGLHHMAHTLKAAPEKLNDVVDALSSKVHALSTDAGWWGDAATQFTQKWSEDSQTAGALADATRASGDAIEELASILEDLEKALYNAAHEAQKQGVPVRPDGKPPVLATSPNPSPDQQKVADALHGYAQDYQQTIEAAKNARVVTEGKLRDIFSAIGPDQKQGQNVTASQALTVGGYIKSLYAIPGGRNRQFLDNAESDLNKAKSDMVATRSDYQAAKQHYEAKGMKLPKDDPARLAHAKTSNALADVRSRISAAEKGLYTNSMSSALDTRVTDIPKYAGVSGRLPSFLKGVSALGVVSTGVGAALDTRTDMQKGESLGTAAGTNATSGAAGLGAGIAIGEAVGGPAALGVSVGVVGSVVVGDAVKEGINENWSEDIHKHGVLKGIGTGVGHTAVNTAKDVTQLGKSVWNTVF